MPEFADVHHIALTVTNLEASTRWYQRVLGFREVRTAALGGFLLSVLRAPPSPLSLTLCQHPANAGEAFDETRTGLDHLSLAVADADALRSWMTHLDQMGVAHAPVAEDPYGAVLVFRDPDNIQLELVAPIR